MKKFLTIALLVMALCVVSMAVSAELTATYDQTSKVATVSAPTANAGQAVVLVVAGENLDTNDLVINATQTAEALAAKIVYVDQATATAGGKATFNFIPRESITDTKSTVFFSDGTTVSTKLLDTTPVTSHTVTFDTAGGDAITAVTVKSNETYTLPTPTRVGFEFKGWELDGVAVTAIANPTGNKTVVAKWEAYFSAENGEEDKNTTNEAVSGASATADAIVTENGYKMSVTTKVADTVKEKKIVKFGFYFYNEAMTKSISKSKDGDLGTNEGFYAEVGGIKDEHKDKNVYFKPFVVAEEDGKNVTYWGAGAFHKVSDFIK